MTLGGSSIEIRDFQKYSESRFALIDNWAMRIWSVTGEEGPSEVLPK